MEACESIAVDTLNDLLWADFANGRLFWKARSERHFNNGPRGTPSSYAETFNKRFAGKEAFTAQSHGYRVGRLNHRMVRAHRVLWAMAMGRWPKGELDHINGNRADNRLENLRECIPSENMINQASKSGRFKGVYFSKSAEKWHASIGVNRKKKHIGYFDCERDAALAYDAAALEIYGPFARLNFPSRLHDEGV